MREVLWAGSRSNRVTAPFDGKGAALRPFDTLRAEEKRPFTPASKLAGPRFADAAGVGLRPMRPDQIGGRLQIRIASRNTRPEFLVLARSRPIELTRTFDKLRIGVDDRGGYSRTRLCPDHGTASGLQAKLGAARE
jgi:hypothetical protein